MTPEVDRRLDEVLRAAKALKLAVEEACRLIWHDKAKAEKLLTKALKKAEEAGL